jgi:hypothetical protein
VRCTSGYVSPMKRARRDIDQGAAAKAADRAQAEYFRGLLAQHGVDTDQAIAEYQAAMDEQKARGDVTGIGELSRQVHVAEQERASIDQMIAALDRRFPLAGLPTAPAEPLTDEIVQPDGGSVVTRSGAGARRRRETRVS